MSTDNVAEIEVYRRLEVAYARVDSLWEQLLAMESQRDEARAELERLRGALVMYADGVEHGYPALAGLVADLRQFAEPESAAVSTGDAPTEET